MSGCSTLYLAGGPCDRSQSPHRHTQVHTETTQELVCIGTVLSIFSFSVFVGVCSAPINSITRPCMFMLSVHRNHVCKLYYNYHETILTERSDLGKLKYPISTIGFRPTFSSIFLITIP